MNWGILGAGRIARKFAAALRGSTTAQLAAVGARDLARSQHFAQDLGIPQAYGDYDAVLADPTVTAVYIALPNHLHAPWAVRAAAAGKHVLCEKPLALSADEGAAMFAAAQAAGTWLMEGFMYRFHPQTRTLQDLLAAGAIGRVRLVRVASGFMLDRPEDPRWDAAMGGGALRDVGCYCVNLARMVVGETPARVSASAEWSRGGVDQLLAATIEYPGGALAQISCSFVTPFHQTAQIVGDAGVITLERPFTLHPDTAATIQLWRGAHFAPLETIAFEPTNHYQLEAEGLAALIAAGHGAHGLPAMPLVETLDNLATIDALLRSAREARRVELVN